MNFKIFPYVTLCYVCWILIQQFSSAQKYNSISNTEDEIIRNDFTFKGIPESLLLQMKHIRSISQFFKKFILPTYNNPEVVNQFIKNLSNASNPFGTKKAPDLVNARRALAAAGLEVEQFAGCIPELQVVKLEKPSSSGVMLWPPCVRARRCGGCCTSKLLECRSVESWMTNITVLQVRYNPFRPDAFESEGLKVIPLEQHERCVCGCKQKADQCIAGLQEYRQSECRCVCLNIDQALQCLGPERMWDSGDCTCKCRYPAECSTGFFFSFRTCRCEVFRVPMLAFHPATREFTGRNISLPTEETTGALN